MKNPQIALAMQAVKKFGSSRKRVVKPLERSGRNQSDAGTLVFAASRRGGKVDACVFPVDDAHGRRCASY